MPPPLNINAARTAHIPVNRRHEADVVLVAGPEPVGLKAIRSMLCAASEELNEFLGVKHANDIVIEVPDDDPDALQYILRLIHEPDSDLALSSSMVLFKFIWKLTKCARKYGLVKEVTPHVLNWSSGSHDEWILGVPTNQLAQAMVASCLFEIPRCVIFAKALLIPVMRINPDGTGSVAPYHDPTWLGVIRGGDQVANFVELHDANKMCCYMQTAMMATQKRCNEKLLSCAPILFRYLTKEGYYREFMHDAPRILRLPPSHPVAIVHHHHDDDDDDDDNDNSEDSEASNSESKPQLDLEPLKAKYISGLATNLWDLGLMGETSNSTKWSDGLTPHEIFSKMFFFRGMINMNATAEERQVFKSRLANLLQRIWDEL